MNRVRWQSLESDAQQRRVCCPALRLLGHDRRGMTGLELLRPRAGHDGMSRCAPNEEKAGRTWRPRNKQESACRMDWTFGRRDVYAISESAVSMLASTFWLSSTKACLVRPAETAGQKTFGRSKKSAGTSPAAAFVSHKK